MQSTNLPHKVAYPGVDNNILCKVNPLFIYTLAQFPDVCIYSTSQKITQTFFLYISRLEEQQSSEHLDRN